MLKKLFSLDNVDIGGNVSPRGTSDSDVLKFRLLPGRERRLVRRQTALVSSAAPEIDFRKALYNDDLCSLDCRSVTQQTSPAMTN